MNELWIKDSHKNAIYYRNKSNISITIYLDIVGMFETSWLIFNHYGSKKYNYGKYSK